MIQNGVLLAMIILSQIAGFFLLAFSQTRHWRTVSGQLALGRPATILFRVFGSALIALSLLLSLWRDGVDYGALLWTTMLTASAVVVTLLLGWLSTRNTRR